MIKRQINVLIVFYLNLTERKVRTTENVRF